MPKISVILPVYNGETYLKESIESILEQSYKDFELIIVDDCSTDKTSLIAQNYAKSNSKITYIRNETNLKLPEALNKGFSLASGEYWTWTSCDNRYLPSAFEKLVTHLEKETRVGLVYSSMQLINEQGEIKGTINADPSDDLILRNVVGACFLYKASVAKQVGVYRKDMFLCEDYEYWLRLARLISLKPINTILYQYRSHSKSLSHQHGKEIISKGVRLQKTNYPFFCTTREKKASFYAHLRARDIYNPFRQLYLFLVLRHSPIIFYKEVWGLIMRRFKKS